MSKSSSQTRKLVLLSVLTGIALLMQYLNFPLPMFPSFLKIDFSEIPALIGAFLFGPLSGVLIEFLKNVLHFLLSGSETGAIPLGQMANFVAGSLFVITSVWISNKIKGVKGMVIGTAIATIFMTTLLTVANYFVIFPLYSYLINWTVTGEAKDALIFYGVAPFNLLKGILIGVLFIPLYQKLFPILTLQVKR
ncbi:ECF transporter S component [Shimazuella kribbensis]|uniref:ECF transporter S component n=1 Tax=Shimazuella kribbensis TaxID=139808 RepID=UPI0004244DA1|nr:ECF transporter S component [Shimazuella kribbensis]